VGIAHPEDDDAEIGVGAGALNLSPEQFRRAEEEFSLHVN
jgi:hypothetical protein